MRRKARIPRGFGEVFHERKSVYLSENGHLAVRRFFTGFVAGHVLQSHLHFTSSPRVGFLLAPALLHACAPPYAKSSVSDAS